MTPELLVLMLGALVVLALAVIVGLALGLYRGRSVRPAIMPTAIDTESTEDGEPTDVAVLRHAHRFAPKDEDGIRHCRCGDRYLDGMVV